MTVGIEGALFPIRSPFQATHHYLHSIVEQANVLPLCIRERNKQQRRRRLRTRPGGVLRFSSDRDDRSGAKIKTQTNP